MRAADGGTHIWASSHIGGHRYAGNAIVYPPGDWFGRINSATECERIVAAYGEGTAAAVVAHPPKELADLWRGRAQMSHEEQMEAFEQQEEG